MFLLLQDLECLLLNNTTAALLSAWTIRHKKSIVVKASQPEILFLVAMGCTMIASAILPLTIEGGYRYQRDAITLQETDDLNENIKVRQSTIEFYVSWGLYFEQHR